MDHIEKLCIAVSHLRDAVAILATRTPSVQVDKLLRETDQLTAEIVAEKNGVSMEPRDGAVVYDFRDLGKVER